MSWPERIERAYALAAKRATEASTPGPSWADATLAAETLDEDASAFLAWARHDPWWTLVVAECATQVCAKPAEAAVFVLVEGLRQRLVDDGILDEED